jgi:uncharacterized protein involved in exopolysaccharide biosynthesis
MPAIQQPLSAHVLVLRRRKWWFAVPAALVLAAAATLIAFWPPVYRSEATILIEEAEIPQDLQGVVVSEYVEKRFEAITRRVMVSDSLLGLVERYDLYPAERRRQPMSKVVAAMREDVHAEMVRANIVDPRSGQRRSLTIAFTLAFDYPQPEVAQRVTNELVSLYLNENIRQRRERAAETARFLRGSLDQAEERVRAVERRLAEFKLRHAGLLPEEQAGAQAGIARLEAEERELERQRRALTEREAYLAAKLAQTEPRLAHDPSGQPTSPAARLEALQAELVRLTARYSADHPDVVRLRREVEALAATTGGGSGTAGLRRERDRLSGQVATLARRYGEDHPELVAARRELARLEDALRAARARGTPADGFRPDNPAYVALQADLASARAELGALAGQQAATAKALAERRERELAAPQVEREFLLLQRQLQDATAAREELTRMDASVSLGQSLESGIGGERLSLIEPPSLPERPVRPDRRLLLLAGLVLALLAGTAAVIVVQLLDDAVGSPQDIDALLGALPLAVVPHVPSPAERVLARLRPVLVLGLVAVVLALVYARHAPLDALARLLPHQAPGAAPGGTP